MERLAELLHVDEVQLAHGPKGVAIHVRIEKSWHSTTIDNEDLEDAHGKKRLEVIAEHLSYLADAHIHKARGGEALRKAQLREQEEANERRRYAQRLAAAYGMSWADVGGWKPYDSPQQQVQRVELAPRAQPLPAVSSEPAVSKSLPSRFHAIVEELRKM